MPNLYRKLSNAFPAAVGTCPIPLHIGQVVVLISTLPPAVVGGSVLSLQVEQIVERSVSVISMWVLVSRSREKHVKECRAERQRSAGWRD